MKLLTRFKGLSSRIYLAFLVAAGVPVMVAGMVGIYLSLALQPKLLRAIETQTFRRVGGHWKSPMICSRILFMAHIVFRLKTIVRQFVSRWNKLYATPS